MTLVRNDSKYYFKSHALELLRWIVGTKDPRILNNRGRPVLKVRPYREEDPREKLLGTLLRYEDPTEPTGEAWEALG